MTTPETATRESTAQPWIPGDETFGARLALIRQHMGWGNVAEAAQACSVPVPSWRNWERDGRNPRDIVDIAKKIADRTGCDYLWLLTGRRIGRSVTAAAGTGTAVTSTKPVITNQPRPSSPVSRTLPKRATTRPNRTVPHIPELMPDTPMELLGA